MSKRKRGGIHDYQQDIYVNDCVQDAGSVWGDFVDFKGFLMLPNVFFRTSLGLKPNAKAVLGYLMSWMVKYDPCKPLRDGRSEYLSQGDMAEACSMSINSVQRAIKDLRERRLITTQQSSPREPLIYRVEIWAIIKAIQDEVPEWGPYLIQETSPGVYEAVGEQRDGKQTYESWLDDRETWHERRQAEKDDLMRGAWLEAEKPPPAAS